MADSKHLEDLEKQIKDDKLAQDVGAFLSGKQQFNADVDGESFYSTRIGIRKKEGKNCLAIEGRYHEEIPMEYNTTVIIEKTDNTLVIERKTKPNRIKIIK
jgi:hypothetical protein